MESVKGEIYIVGTPIGNLQDITLRAIDTLKKVDIILAEDTRQTLKLLNHLEISKKMISYHRHNEVEKIKSVEELLDEGKSIALVSDAGMPRISDPGEPLIKDLILKGYKINIIPGVTAVATAVVMCNFDAERFVFEGFLPMRSTRRKERIESFKNEKRLLVLYEAPHKLLKTLKDLYNALGNRNICIARELTKIHEECLNLTISDAIEKVERDGIKGEIVLIIEGTKEEKKEVTDKSLVEMVEEYLETGIDKKEAIKKVAKEQSLTKNEVYMECVKKWK